MARKLLSVHIDWLVLTHRIPLCSYAYSSINKDFTSWGIYFVCRALVHVQRNLLHLSSRRTIPPCIHRSLSLLASTCNICHQDTRLWLYVVTRPQSNTTRRGYNCQRIILVLLCRTCIDYLSKCPKRDSPEMLFGEGSGYASSMLSDERNLFSGRRYWVRMVTG